MKTSRKRVSKPSATKKLTLSRPGLIRVSTKVKRRALVKAAGRDKTGKTRLVLTGPEPVVHMQFDAGDLEGVAQHFKGKDLHAFEYLCEGSEDDNLAQAEAKEVLDRFLEDYYWALRNARTVSLNAEPEIWELYRAAWFGNAQPSPYNWRNINTAYRKMIREAYNHECNLVVINKMYPEYQDVIGGYPKRTGSFEEKGFKDLPFLVQANVMMDRDPREMGLAQFKMTVEDCRQNGEINGMEFDGDEINLKGLLRAMFPNFPPEEFD